MAVAGYLHEIIKNHKFNPRITAALKYLSRLKAKDFSGLNADESRKVELQGKKLFAISQAYETKNHSLVKFEAHRKYIDLQFIFDGREVIYISSRRDAGKAFTYDPDKDVQFFSDVARFSRLDLKKGMVAVFFPDDLHAPGLVADRRVLVKKTVVKAATK